MKNKLLNSVIDNIKTILIAAFIAIFIRSFLVQPFYIPSSSMEPSLLIGDRIFVTKYSYGYSKHSFPFSPPIFKNRIFSRLPERGDLVVFKTPSDNRTDYIKRLIGLPGDTIIFKNNNFFLNGKKIPRTKKKILVNNRCGPYKFNYNYFLEQLPNGVKYIAAYKTEDTFNNNFEYIVPKDHFFLIGDNRDCSNDSRIDVGYVNKINLVGKARLIFFSNDSVKGSVLKFWQWNESLRLNRFFKKI